MTWVLDVWAEPQFTQTHLLIWHIFKDLSAFIKNCGLSAWCGGLHLLTNTWDVKKDLGVQSHPQLHEILLQDRTNKAKHNKAKGSFFFRNVYHRVKKYSALKESMKIYVTMCHPQGDP